MKRDRDGEVIDVDVVSPSHSCVRGWTGEDKLGRPAPCPTCKPWLTDRAIRTPVVKRKARRRHQVSASAVSEVHNGR